MNKKRRLKQLRDRELGIDNDDSRVNIHSHSSSINPDLYVDR